MLANHILTSEQFTTIHNAKSDIYKLQRDLGEILAPKYSEQIESIIARLEHALVDVYKAEEAEEQKRYELYQKIAEDNHLDNSEWAVLGVSDFSEVPYPKATKLQINGVIHDIKEGSSWLDLWIAVNKISKMNVANDEFVNSFVSIIGIRADRQLNIIVDVCNFWRF